MEIIARLLQEKYDEEFTVIDTWPLAGISYRAVCSPVAEPGILFEADYDSKDSGRLRYDGYVQGIVAWQLEKLLLPDVQKISEDAYIKAFVFWQETDITRRENVSIESYLQAIGPEGQHIMLDVYANNNTIENIDYEKVYSVLESISTSIAPNSGSIGLYYISDEDIEHCREYFLKRSETYPELSGILDEYKWYGTGIVSGVMKESYEQFTSEMEEIVHGGV
jgi:hypothetical protein